MSAIIESTTRSQYGTWIEIRLSRLQQNLKTLKTQAGDASQVLAVVKANAYGHGLLKIAENLAGQVTYLGVSSLREALELKEHAVDSRIFIFGRLLSEELPAALVEGLTLSVSSFEEARDISDLSLSLSQKTQVHIKVDTGMGRLGIPFAQALPTIIKIAQLEGINAEGIYTHFPIAESESMFTHQQLNDFTHLVESLEGIGISFEFRHASNSAATIRIKTPYLNLIRPGLTLYGVYPSPTLEESIRLAPILTLKSRLITVKHLSAGDSAGYGRDFIAKKPTTIGVLPIGYSHGYPFTASNRAQVLFKGKRYSLAGRVSMDYLTIDLGSDAIAKLGDEVTLIGEEQNDRITVEELAGWAKTIPYEIATRLLPSLPRLYR